MIQGHLMTSPKCVHRVHVTQTTGYLTILTILIQIFHVFSQIHILFSKSLFFKDVYKFKEKYFSFTLFCSINIKLSKKYTIIQCIYDLITCLILDAK